LLKRSLPKNPDTFPRERRVERIPVNIGVIVPERKKLEEEDLAEN